MTDPDVSNGALAALLTAHTREMRELQARLAVAEALLAEHGIWPPTEGLTHLEACRAVVRGAYELLPHLQTLADLVGSGVEMLPDTPWSSSIELADTAWQ